ncbi:hypothetical protein BC827DRAFT_1227028 [Russula dissimulans]|nr:hypothetical protein BC827DRAFT_1227028 [Russula dissimulans]
MSITNVPIALFLSVFLLVYQSLRAVPVLRNLLSVPSLVPTWAFKCFYGLLLFLYICGRLVLLVLAFLTLRSLPPATFHTVRWTSFIPHI